MSMIIDGTNGLSDVDGSASTPAIRGTDSNTGIFFPAVDTIAFSEGGVEAMRIDSSGNVGVGTASPLGKIDASWGGRTAGQIPAILVGANSDSTTRSDATQKMGVIGAAHYTNAQSPVGLISSNSYASNNDVYVGGGFAGSNAATTLSFWTAANSTTTQGTERMRIDSSGNVLVGTTTNLGKLAVQGTITAKASADESILSISHNGSEGIISASYGSTGSYDPMVFKTSDTERMRIDSSGNLLVGATAQVYSGKQVIAFSGAVHNAVAINETANTSNAVYIGFLNNGTAIGSVGRVGATAAVSYNTTSDKRLKSNIADANPILDKLMNVKVRQFDWAEGNLHQDAGFIAQELAPILSGIVIEGKTEADYWQLDYSKLTPYLVKAIQEQQAIITDLTTRLSELENK
jgi:hypothetical protein